MPVVTVQDLRIYPVKALHGDSHPRVTVERWGLAGDRRWMVIQPNGRFLTQRELPAMARIRASTTVDGLSLDMAGADHHTVAFPEEATADRRPVSVWNDDVFALDAGEEAADWLTTALHHRCRLVYLDDVTARPVHPDYGMAGDHVAFTDGFPLLVTTTASLGALNGALARPIPMDRFRPNIVFDGTGPWAEDHWRRIRIGGVSFRVVKPCSRCITTTVDQETGERPDRAEPLRTLARMRRTDEGVIFGQNLIPDGSGTISVGDQVEILEEGESNVVLLPAG